MHNYIASTFQHALDMQLYMYATNNALYTMLQGESIDIDKSLEEVDLAEPYIAAFGVTLAGFHYSCESRHRERQHSKHAIIVHSTPLLFCVELPL